MAMTTVYFWRQLDLTGHVSVGIEDNYMSFHPKNRNWIADVVGTPGYLVDMSEDEDKYGAPRKTIRINWLDTDAMNSIIQTFDRLIERDDLDYSLAGRNCSTLAMELLCGGASEVFSSQKSLSQLISSLVRSPFKHDHGRLLELAREVVEDVGIVCMRRGRIGRLGAFLAPAILVDLATREFVWAPGDVEKFATKLATQNH